MRNGRGKWEGMGIVGDRERGMWKVWGMWGREREYGGINEDMNNGLDMKGSGECGIRNVNVGNGRIINFDKRARCWIINENWIRIISFDKRARGGIINENWISIRGRRKCVRVGRGPWERWVGVEWIVGGGGKMWDGVMWEMDWK